MSKDQQDEEAIDDMLEQPARERYVYFRHMEDVASIHDDHDYYSYASIPLDGKWIRFDSALQYQTSENWDDHFSLMGFISKIYNKVTLDQIARGIDHDKSVIVLGLDALVVEFVGFDTPIEKRGFLTAIAQKNIHVPLPVPPEVALKELESGASTRGQSHER